MWSGHKWERVPHAWENDPEPGEEQPWDDSSDSDLEAAEGTTPGGEFVDMMMNLLLTRELNARIFCELCFMAGQSGIEEAKPYGLPNT